MTITRGQWDNARQRSYRTADEVTSVLPSPEKCSTCEVAGFPHRPHEAQHRTEAPQWRAAAKALRALRPERLRKARGAKRGKTPKNWRLCSTVGFQCV
jgi:hypothetical protein